MSSLKIMYQTRLTGVFELQWKLTFSRKRFIITNKDIYVFCSTFDMLFLIYMSLLKIMHHSRLTSVFESQGKSLHNMGVLPFMHPERDYLRINLYIITMFTGLLDISAFFSSWFKSSFCNFNFDWFDGHTNLSGLSFWCLYLFSNHFL